MSADPRVEGAIARGGEPLAIVAEITHRVFNEYTHAIAGLNHAAAHASDPGSRTSLSDAAERLRAYAEAHRTLQAPLVRAAAGSACRGKPGCGAGDGSRRSRRRRRSTPRLATETGS
jgi:hypothetical protein